MRIQPLATKALAAAAALLLGATSLHAAATASHPVAVMSYPVTNSSITSFGVPFTDLVKFGGYNAGVTADTLSISSPTGWAVNQFMSGPHFVTIRTGAQAGRTLRIISHTTHVLTLDVGSVPLNTAGFAVNVNTDAFEVYAGDTLGSLFGTSVTAGLLSSGVKAGTATSNADVIYLPNGANWDTYFFNTSLGYWVLDGSTTNQNNLLLYPDDAFLIYRNGTTGALTFHGRAPTTRLLSNFPGGTSNFIAHRFPASATLGTLNFGTPGTWITGTSSTAADTVSLWNASGYYWQTYYKNTSNQWIEVDGDGSDQSNLEIPRGTGLLIDKKGTGTGAASFLGQNLPYGL